jgi:hypothetical protein
MGEPTSNIARLRLASVSAEPCGTNVAAGRQRKAVRRWEQATEWLVVAAKLLHVAMVGLVDWWRPPSLGRLRDTIPVGNRARGSYCKHKVCRIPERAAA